MRAIAVAAILGIVAGASALWVVTERGWRPARAVSAAIGDVPKMSFSAAETERANQYASIRSIENVLALPGPFAQSEALYTLAGRSDSAAVQDLIFQAGGIVDPSDRQQTLIVLFSRLTELDPASALALSRTAGFRFDRDYEAVVWKSWGALDLEAALRAAAALDSDARLHRAAQSLMAAYDYWGNDKTRHVVDVLGVEPDRGTRARYIDRLAATDPVAAIAYIKRMASAARRREAASMLGDYLGQNDFEDAMHYAALFDESQDREAYSGAVAYAAIQIDPVATLDRLLLQDPSSARTGLALAAFRALATQDIERALLYFDRLGNAGLQRPLAGVVGAVLARENPQRALAWAVENDRSTNLLLYMQVLGAVAGTSPDLALAAAGRQDSRHRIRAYQTVVNVIASRDPQEAVELVGHIERPEERKSISGMLALQWIRSDPEAALSWIQEWDPADREKTLARAANILTNTDLDGAIRLLPRLDEKSRSAWRIRIASKLAAERSIGEAQAFIARFEGSDDYPKLLSSAIGGLAQNDIRSALPLIRRLPAGRERDILYANLLRRYAADDPQKAAAWLPSIADDRTRTRATLQITNQWYRADPDMAERWARSLPHGDQRDRAITGLAMNWREGTASRTRLVESIADGKIRQQAVLAYVVRVARADPAKGERLLRDLHMSDEERQQVRAMLKMFGPSP